MNALLLAALLLAPCNIEEVGSARCGAVKVPENRTVRGSRQIGLNVVVLPATGVKRAKEAIYIFQGGPGQAATTLADFYARTYEGARARHDIVLVDQRGTGKSNGLRCPYPEGALDLFPPDVIRRCRESLSADLARYTTDEAVRDAEAVRRALGYDRLHLYGTSYGTRVAMRYAQLYPRRVRTLTLKGVVPPLYRLPETFAADTERALELTFEDCAADADCRARYPELRRDFEKLRAALPHGELTRGVVAAGMRSILQSTGSAADLPRLIHAAAEGNWEPLESTIRRIRKQASEAVFTGMMLSVACSEDVAFVNGQQVDQTFMGSYWIDQLRGGCAEWKVPKVEMKPAVVRVPALLISGHLDPATPPRMAEEARTYLPRSTPYRRAVRKPLLQRDERLRGQDHERVRERQRGGRD
jgi:pimeloyl-ACP methyl ester carboxylesterase